MAGAVFASLFVSVVCVSAALAIASDQTIKQAPFSEMPANANSAANPFRKTGAVQSELFVLAVIKLLSVSLDAGSHDVLQRALS